MIDAVKLFIKTHFAKIIIGLVALVALFIVLSELTGRKEGPSSSPEMSPPDSTVVQTRLPQLRQPQLPSAQPPKEEAPAPQISRTVQETQTDTAAISQGSQVKEKGQAEISRLQKEQQSLAKQIAEMRSDDEERRAWDNEQLQMLDNHARQIGDLGRTLQQVFKTPRQIRIIAADFQGQANALRSQGQSTGQPAGGSSVQQNIQAERQSTLADMTSDLDDIALKLLRTQGDPSRIKVMAIEIQRQSEQLQATIESKRRQKPPTNSQLAALENKHDALKAEIQTLQQQQAEDNL